MWPLKQLRIHPPELPLLLTALAVLAGLPGAVRAQIQPNIQPRVPPPLAAPPTDRVEQLRRTLEIYPGNDEQLFNRGEELKKRIAALQNLGELRRALMLTEWKYVDKLNFKLTEQDLLYRQKIGEKFKKTVEHFLKPGMADAAVRMALANMIGDMGTSVRALTPNDPAGFTRTLAPDLVQLLRDPSPDVRAAAARSLGRINADSKEIYEPLTKALTKDPVTAVRRAAAEGFLNWVKLEDELTRTGIDAAVSARPEDEVDVIRSLSPAVGLGVRDPDPEVRRRCLQIIQQAALAVPVQRPLSADNLRSPEYVAGSIRAVPQFLDLWRPIFVRLREQKDVLAATLQDPDPRVRAMAFQAVQEIAFLRLRIGRWINSVPAAEPMGKGAWRAVRQPAPIVLAAARQVLPQPKVQKPGSFEEKNLTAALLPSVKVLARGISDPNPRVRLSAIEFLDFMEDAAAPAADVLLKALGDRNRFVRWAAARALGKMPSVSPDVVVAGVTPLLRDLDLDVRMVAAGTLEHLGPKAAPAVPALSRAITEMSDPEGLLAMLNTLRGIHGEAGQAAVPQIASLLSNPITRVRRAAAETLGSYGAYARPAEPALRRNLNDEELEVRQAVSDALLAIAPQPK
jgi:HEAT repeat protein